MSSSRRVAMTSAMAGCRARRLDSNLRGDRFAAALAPRVNGLCRSVLLAVTGNLAIPRRSESHAFDVVNCAGVRPAGSQRRTALEQPRRWSARLIKQKLDAVSYTHLRAHE